MNIEYLRQNQINREKWDEAIANSHNRLVYAFSWYLDVVSPGWEALATEGYGQVMPLTRSSKFGLPFLAQPLVTQQLGVFGRQPLAPGQVQQFLNAIPAKFLYININLNSANKISEVKHFKTAQRKNYLLPLNRPYKEVFSSYHKYRRKNVRKAQGAGFELRESLSAQELVTFYKEHLQQKISHVKPKQFLKVQKILETLIQRKKLYRKEAWLNGELLATFAVALDEPYCIYLHGAATEKGKKLYATEFLIDYFVRQFAGQPLVLDFEGSVIPGIAYFYQSFGANESLYLQVQGTQILKLWQRGKM